MTKFLVKNKVWSSIIDYGPFRNHGLCLESAQASLAPRLFDKLMHVFCVRAQGFRWSLKPRLKTWFRKGPIISTEAYSFDHNTH